MLHTTPTISALESIKSEVLALVSGGCHKKCCSEAPAAQQQQMIVMPPAQPTQPVPQPTDPLQPPPPPTTGPTMASGEPQIITNVDIKWG